MNTVFSTSLSLWMDRIAWFARAKVLFPDEEAGRVIVSYVSNTHRSALAHVFLLPNPFYQVRGATDSDPYHMVDT